MNENCFFHVSHSLHIFNWGKVLPLESNISEIKLRKNDLKFNFLKQCFHNAKIIVACSWKEKSFHHCRKNISVNKNMRWMEIYRADGFIYICCRCVKSKQLMVVYKEKRDVVEREVFHCTIPWGRNHNFQYRTGDTLHKFPISDTFSTVKPMANLAPPKNFMDLPVLPNHF